MKFAEIFSHVSHRPFPLSDKPWVMKQTWHDLLFMHWEVPEEALRPLIPSTLELDKYEGKTYLGVVPFRMSGIRYRFTPAFPFLSAFLELNVRTYVKKDGVPGVWFLSLDAANPIAVEVARKFFHLPYMNAKMYLDRPDSMIHYHSIRKDERGKPAVLELDYQPVSEVYESTSGSLEHWLTERYCLYSVNRWGRLFRGDIHHLPWTLQKAKAKIFENTMAESHGIALPDSEPILQFVKKIEVAIYSLQRV